MRRRICVLGPKIPPKFDVDSAAGDGSCNPDSTYDNWKFISIRDNKESD